MTSHVLRLCEDAERAFAEACRARSVSIVTGHPSVATSAVRSAAAKDRSIGHATLSAESERLQKRLIYQAHTLSAEHRNVLLDQLADLTIRAERAEAQRDRALALLADAIPDPKGAIDPPEWHRRLDALATSLVADD